MCYDVIACPVCGEWVDEFIASLHKCKVSAKEPAALEKPIELLVPANKKNHK